VRGRHVHVQRASATTPVLSLAVGKLNWRTGYAAVRAEHATVTGLWPEQGFARWAFVEPLARIRRHGQGFRVATNRAGKQGLERNSIHTRSFPTWVICAATSRLIGFLARPY
jgi:hypothetical protein